MNSSQLINQDSGNCEYYTPAEIVGVARELMGSIDLDPFSSKIANEQIKASRIFTKEDDGLNQDWSGNVWMNHPFSRGWTACTDKCDRKTCTKRGFHIYEDLPSNKDFIGKLLHEYGNNPDLLSACCITFASTSEAWFRPLLQFPQCFIHGRTNYYLPDGTKKKGVTKGSVVTYLGPNKDKFKEVFSRIGTVK